MKRYSVYAAVCALCLMFSAGQLSAASPVSARIQERYAGVQSMKASFIQVLFHKESGSKEERSGTLYFKKPLQVRWETNSPVEELLVVTDAFIWNVFPEENLAYKYPPQLVDDSRSLVRVITGQARLSEDFTIEDAGKEDALIKLNLFPKEPTQALTEMTLWVDPVSYMLKRVRVDDFYGNQNEITFVSQENNLQLPASLFSFSPGPKMKVEDRSSSGVIEKPLLQ